MKKFDKELTFKQKLSAIKKIRNRLIERENNRMSAYICFAAYDLRITTTCGIYLFKPIFPEMYEKLRLKCGAFNSLGYHTDFETRYQFLNELEKELKEKHNEK